MKKNYILLSLLCAAFLFYNCTETSEGFLDSKGADNPDTEAVFADSAYTVQFHTAIYMQLGRIAMAPHPNSSMINDYKDYEAGTDNSRHVHFAKSEFTPAYTKGDFTQSGINANYSLFKTSWQEMYQSIQRSNTFLKYYENAPLSDARKESMVGEAKFLRAFYYFHLLRSYGAMPIMGDEVLDPFEDHLIPRSTFAEAVEYLEEQLEEAVLNLPEVQDGVDYGRPTKAAALGVLAKLQVLAASPLHNGGNVGTGANRALVGYDDYQVSRWEKAAKTLEKLIALGTHDLIVDNETRPGNGFYEATTTRVSKERVWFWLTTNAYTFPNKQLFPASRGGLYRIAPYHELVEAFPDINGKAITESDVYDIDNPYANRDPRMSYTIIYNGAKWIKTINGTQETVDIYKDEQGNSTQDASNTATGYFFRKCCREEQLGGTTNSEAQGLSFIRYADILLMYAEALTEIDVDANRNKIEEQLFAIRDRAGINPGDDERYGIAENLTKEEMLDLIINERRIEFANECGNRFFDLKRRKLYENLNEVWTSKVSWVKSGNFFTWTAQPLEQHFFDTPRMYFSPIPQSEINSSNNTLIQNPGW